MKHTSRVALAALTVCLSFATFAPATAAEIDGHHFADNLKLGSSELVVNGTGIRSKFGRRYAMALYVPARSGDARTILAMKGPKRIAITLIKDVDGDTFANAVSKGINANSSEAEQAALKERVKQLVDTVVALGEIKAGSSIAFDWLPEKGTVLAINGQPKGREIAGEDFYAALLRVWLGDDPVQKDLKQGLLGKAG